MVKRKVSKPKKKQTKVKEELRDPLQEVAVKIVIYRQEVSASFLQRNLKIGFARASRLIDEMEEDKIIGPARGAKPRKVLVKKKAKKKVVKKAKVVKEKKGKGPSVRMLVVFTKVLESMGKVSIGQAMRDQGYPVSTANNPQQLTRSKGWQKMLQEAFPHDMVLKYHHVLANSFKLGHSVFPLGIKDEDIVTLLDSTNCTVVKIQYGEQAKHVWFWSPDNMARDRVLEKINKMKGVYAPQKFQMVDPNEDMSDDELDAEEEKLNKEIAEFEKEEAKAVDKKKPKAKKKANSA
ncbi:MAG TPA: hypothetical protein ENI23_16160 [bacterium]|nr:hypothetical protein [bacterium]